jgi:hypothetical protein
MTNPLENIRGELSTLFDPPTDLMLDPSMLVAASTLERLADSQLFEAHTQATLFQSAGDTHVCDVYVPETFHRLLVQEGRVDAERTEAWNQYKRQATPATPASITERIDELGISVYAGRDRGDITTPFTNGEDTDNEWLTGILEDSLTFLVEGGVLFLRSGVTLDALRDAGVPTLDIGDATLAEKLDTRLKRIGYGDPATLCAFGLRSGGTVLEALNDTVLSAPADALVYRVG